VRVELAYGETGLAIDVPADRTTVVVPRQIAAVPDARAAVVAALRQPTAGPPLRDRVRPGQTVAISMCDGTRPQPRHVMIPALLDELDGIVHPDDVVVLVATGTHRGNTQAELRSMLGADVLDRARVVNHDARRIGDPRATWGVTVGNPVHDAVRQIAEATGVDFAVDVLLDRGHRIVDVFAGDLTAEHAAACGAARRLAMVAVPAEFDVVVTTNAGFPLDQNLYQCVKGMSAGAAVVRPGGTLVCAAECRDGFPDHGSYREVLASQPTPAALLQAIETRRDTEPDQWQAQIQCRVQARARVLVHTGGLTAAELATAHLEPAGDVSATVRDQLDRLGPAGTLCVLPEGPQTIPYVEAP
jgi:nickel-dependent lactate racemase